MVIKLREAKKSNKLHKEGLLRKFSQDEFKWYAGLSPDYSYSLIYRDPSGVVVTLGQDSDTEQEGEYQLKVDTFYTDLSKNPNAKYDLEACIKSGFDFSSLAQLGEDIAEYVSTCNIKGSARIFNSVLKKFGYEEIYD